METITNLNPNRLHVPSLSQTITYTLPCINSHSSAHTCTQPRIYSHTSSQKHTHTHTLKRTSTRSEKTHTHAHELARHKHARTLTDTQKMKRRMGKRRLAADRVRRNARVFIRMKRSRRMKSLIAAGKYFIRH